MKKRKKLENDRIKGKKFEKKNERKAKTMTYRGNETQFLQSLYNTRLFDDTCLQSMAELAVYPIPMSTCRQSLRAGQVLEICTIVRYIQSKLNLIFKENSQLQAFKNIFCSIFKL